MLVKKGKKYKLVSKSNPSKVLANYGTSKPSAKAVAKREKQVQFFKNREKFAKDRGISLNEASKDMTNHSLRKNVMHEYHKNLAK